VEINPEKVPLIQKHIIRQCNLAGKPVITATQMLESMISSPRPTRAETSDVANAILDGSDAIMLSAETASGKFPCEAVAMMVRVAEDVERDAQLKEQFFHPLAEQAGDRSLTESIGQAACQVAENVNAAAIPDRQDRGAGRQISARGAGLRCDAIPGRSPAHGALCRGALNPG